MRTVCLALAGALFSQSASAETVRAEICRRGDDLRTIEIVEPGTVGLACDVVYSRDRGANVSVPYNANVDSSFCRASAAEMAAKLIAEGYECAPRLSDAIEASLAGGPGPVKATPAPEPQPVVAAGAPSPAQLPLDQQLERIAAAEPAPEISPDAASAPPPRDEIAELLSQPEAAPVAEPTGYEQKIASAEAPAAAATEAVSAEPVHLAAGAQASEFRAPAPPRSTGARRLVGKAPSLDGIVDAAATGPAVASTAATPPASGLPARDSADIIKSVLAANMAAWNEGNLDAFMAGYADSAELMMVKDDVVVTGWKNVRKSYEEDIAASGMGRLAFDGLNVTIASDDVATVVGRYSVSRSETQSNGVMTLVMKQVEGRWRIMQDTRVAAAASPPALND